MNEYAIKYYYSSSIDIPRKFDSLQKPIAEYATLEKLRKPELPQWCLYDKKYHLECFTKLKSSATVVDLRKHVSEIVFKIEEQLDVKQKVVILCSWCDKKWTSKVGCLCCGNSEKATPTIQVIYLADELEYHIYHPDEE